MSAGLTAANGKCRFAETPRALTAAQMAMGGGRSREQLHEHHFQTMRAPLNMLSRLLSWYACMLKAVPIGVVSWLVHPPISSRFGLTLFRSKFWAPTLPSTLLREVLFCPCLRYFAYISLRVWEMLPVIEKSGLCCCSDRTTAVYRCFCWTNDSELIHGHQKRCESEREWIKEKRQWRNCLFEDELQFWSSKVQ